jgi:hypothetical protein
MPFGFRVAAFICTVVYFGVNRSKKKVNNCPDFIEDDQLTEDELDDSWEEWSEYINRPEVLQNNRNFLESLFQK